MGEGAGPPGMLLAIDTSNQTASVALYHQDGLRQECTWRSEQNHTSELMPTVVSLLAKQGVAAGQLQGVGVALGPGSFNGLRVGVSAAKGLAFALNIPLVGVGTLEILAYPHILTRGLIRPILPAGRGQVSTALFRAFRGRWKPLEQAHLSTLEEICGQTTRRTVFCGQITASMADVLHEQLGRKAVLASPAASWRRAGFLAELAWQRLQAGESDNPITLEPIYLRRPSIGGAA